MDYSEFRSLAIKSAQLYYQYLTDNNKGYSSVGVRSVSPLGKGDRLLLRLSGRLLSLSGLRIRVRNMIFSPEEVTLARYDDKARTLEIRPQKQHLELFRDPRDIHVISDLKFLVRRVHDWYEHTEQLALPTIPPTSLSYDDTTLLRGLSPEQRSALLGILHHPLSYVWGAPGTGKTQFVLARAVLAYCLTGKQILITAPTNNAIEQTLRGVLPILRDAGIPLNKVLRIGTPTADFYSEYPMVCEARTVEVELSGINARIEFLSKARLYYDTQVWLEKVDRISQEQQLKLGALEQQASELSFRQNELERLRRELQNEFLPVFSRIDQLTAKIAKLNCFLAQTRSRLEMRLKRRALGEAELELSVAQRELSEFRSRHDDLLRRDSALLDEAAQLRNTQSEVATAIELITEPLCEAAETCPVTQKSAELLELMRCDGSRRALTSVQLWLREFRTSMNSKTSEYNDLDPDTIQSEINDLSQRRSDLESHSAEARMQDVLVVAATVDGYIGRLREAKHFHPCHVFLDEAAYCPLIKGVTLLAPGVPLTLLGDHMQIPPVCEADSDLFSTDQYASMLLWSQSALYVEDVFCRSFAQLSADYFAEQLPCLCQMQKFDLLHTFRFGETLADILGHFIYTTEFHGNPDLDTNITVLHVKPRSTPEKKNTNPDEAAAVIDFLSKHPHRDFAVLTPYRNQRALLASADPRILSPESVLTIHGSQGREWDTVFLSVVSASPTRFLSLRLINTAISRAKKSLVIVCDRESWSRYRSHLIGALANIAPTP